VTDEIKLHQDAARASRAKLLLENELLIESFKALEAAYTEAWRNTTIDDVTGREKLFLAINVVGKVRDHLNSVITNGVLAQKELDQIATLAERKRRFGII
jgi:hypothetical protein